jgi:membrane-bound ClpP family serine protease
MTKKSLSARQARWAELLSQYHFKIQYQTAAKNQIADTLTRKEEDVIKQEAVKKESREQVMLPPKTLSSKVQEELAQSSLLAPLDVPSEILLTDKIIQANRTNKDLEALREQALE